MKVQAISAQNYYNKYGNRNLREKEPPQPCFQGNGTKIFKKRLPLIATMLIGAAAGLSSCFRVSSPTIVNFDFHDTTCVNNDFTFNFNHTSNFYWICNGDTVQPPIPPDTLNPNGGDTTHVKPNEVWNSIFHDLILPNNDSINDEQLGWPTATDTIGFTEAISETGVHENYTLERSSYDPANSTSVITSYNAVLKDNHNHIDYPCTSGVYKGTYQGEPVYIEMLSYKEGKPKGLPVPDFIVHKQGVAGDKMTEALWYNNGGQLLEKRKNFVDKGSDNQYYFRQQWADSISQYSDQYFNVEMRKIPWSDVPPVAGKNGKK